MSTFSDHINVFIDAREELGSEQNVEAGKSFDEASRGRSVNTTRWPDPEFLEAGRPGFFTVAGSTEDAIYRYLETPFDTNGSTCSGGHIYNRTAYKDDDELKIHWLLSHYDDGSVVLKSATYR